MTETADNSRGRPTRIATLGAAMSANRGAASMLQAVLDRLPDVAGDCRIDVLTTYPAADRAILPDEVRVVSLRPIELALIAFPLALVVALLRAVGLSGRSLAALHPATRSLSEADLVLDLAGISFVDGRSFPILVYNVLMTGTPLLLGAPVVKCAQAVGPFRTPLNRAAARLVLPRCRAVLTRGSRTHEHAVELGLQNAERADDLAFLMDVPERVHEESRQLLDDLEVTRPFVAVSPSSVVKGYCDGIGLDYVGLMAEFTQRMCSDHRVDVVVFPHSARPGQPESRMNDIPVCQALRQSVTDERVHVIEEGLSPTALRAVISESELLVTSRFHAMISALSTETAVLVVGWSHKYEEVLAVFELGGLAIPYEQLRLPELLEHFKRAWNDRSSIRQRVRDHLPSVRAAAAVNFDVISRELDRRSA